jgi:signal transduction histidine kinase
VELHARTSSGTEIPIELSLSTWHVHEDRYYTGIIRDISERKEAENQLRDYAEKLSQQHEELKLAQSQLVESEKEAMLGRLLAGLLHELNTPLGAIRSASDSVGRILDACREYLSGQDNDAAARTRRAVELGRELPAVFDNGTARIESVLHGLSQFVTLEDHPMVEPRDIREMLESALTVLHPRTADRIEIATRIPDEPLWVACHPTRLSHAFLNVLENATDAIDGTGRIEVVAETGDDGVAITIRDSGRGMTEEQMKTAFDFSFYHREGRVRLSLGLATARRAVAEAGGTLDLESMPQKGTTVRVRLPLSDPPEEQ